MIDRNHPNFHMIWEIVKKNVNLNAPASICSDNTNVERKTWSVLKYVVNNLMSIGFMCRKEDGYVFGISCVRIDISCVSYCIRLNGQKEDGYVLESCA